LGIDTPKPLGLLGANTVKRTTKQLDPSIREAVRAESGSTDTSSVRVGKYPYSCGRYELRLDNRMMPEAAARVPHSRPGSEKTSPAARVLQESRVYEKLGIDVALAWRAENGGSARPSLELSQV